MAGKGGRPKGIIKKTEDYDKELTATTTQEVIVPEELDEKDVIRIAISDMLTGNLINLSGWLEGIGESNPEKALTIFKEFAEYVLPKQQREGTKEDRSSPVTINFEPSSMAKINVNSENSPPKKFSLDDIIPD